MDLNLTQCADCSYCKTFGSFFISLNAVYIKYIVCGHIINVKTGQLIMSEEEAEALVRKDVLPFEVFFKRRMDI